MRLDNLITHPGVLLGVANNRAKVTSVTSVLPLRTLLTLFTHSPLVPRRWSPFANSSRRKRRLLEDGVSLMANNIVLKKQMERQTAQHEAETIALQSELKSLKAQLQEARVSAQRRAAALEENETALRIREEACESKNANLKRLKQVLEIKETARNAEAASLAELRRELKTQQEQIAQRLHDLIVRETSLAQSEAESEKKTAIIPSPVIVKPTRHLDIRKPEPSIAARSVAKPHTKLEISRPVASASKPAAEARPTHVARAVGTGTSSATRAKGLTSDTAKTTKQGEYSVARAGRVQSTLADNTGMLPARRDMVPVVPKEAKPSSSAAHTVTKQPPRGSAPDTFARADAILSKRRQPRVERPATTKPAVNFPTNSKRNVRSAGHLRTQITPEAAITAPRPKRSAEDFNNAKSKHQLPQAIKPLQESGVTRPIRAATIENPIRSAVIAPKRGRRSLIPLSKRLQPRLFPRAMAIAA